MKRIAIMQPYFFPYIGYFQLIRSVDQFVVYDNIKYTKKGWINRNRFLRNGADVTFSIPLRNDPDTLDVRERWISPAFERRKLLAQLQGAYRAAPFFGNTYPLLETLVLHEEMNLFGYLHQALVGTCRHLGIGTPIVVSSQVPIDHQLRGEEKVVALCQALGATHYTNAIGGRTLYDEARFAAQGIELRFLQSRPFEYPQLGAPFVPWLSIIDVMMFNSPGRIAEQLDQGYDLVQ